MRDKELEKMLIKKVMKSEGVDAAEAALRLLERGIIKSLFGEDSEVFFKDGKFTVDCEDGKFTIDRKEALSIAHAHTAWLFKGVMAAAGQVHIAQQIMKDIEKGE